ncbi:MAG TPA: citrate/2-methylcitrate synthase [Candidatus Dormibacteraeota bacterium]|nr:citrate/2-methylcitrate synthase [Candidatus Dormibacteraeota bacterium]
MEGKQVGGATLGHGNAAGTEEGLAVTDLRTGSPYRMPIQDGAVTAMDLRKIRVDEEDFGLLAYDPGFTNTAACRSAITFIDGDRGILEYRGYPIEPLAQGAGFLEVAHLLIKGALPSATELKAWEARIADQSEVPQELLDSISRYPEGARPMSILIAAIAGLGAFHPEACRLDDHQSNETQAVRLIAQMPTLAAAAFHAFRGDALLRAGRGLSYPGRFLTELFSDGPDWRPDPVLEKALDVLFLLHADHEQNCSTSAVRSVASAESDPYTSLAGGAAALSGPLHGGANEAVLLMLREIGSKENVPAFIDEVKNHRRRLMGFGHRVYKSYDPRAKVIQRTAQQVFEVTGVNPLLDIALELERIALADSYFVDRKLYPNVDFYSGLIYEALGLPPEMFTLLFAVGRTPGWCAHWLELLDDKDGKLARPRQIYTGPRGLTYTAPR